MEPNFCSTQGGNAGGILCDFDRGVPKKVVVGGKQFSAAEYADADTFQAALLAALKLNTGNSSKLFALPEIFEVEDKTEAPTEGSLALGPKKRLKKGRPSYTYSVEIGWDQYQRLLAYDGKTMPAYTLDDLNNFWGNRAAAAANTPNTNDFKGDQVYITVSGKGFKNGTDAKSGVATISISYISIDDFEKRGTGAILPDISASDLVGLVDVMLSKVSNVTNVYKIKMTIPVPFVGNNTDLNIYDEHAAAIAALTFTAFTGADYSTALTITSVAVDAALKCLTVTFDSTAYTALAGGTKIKLIGPTVVALDAADVDGLEIGSIILTK